MGNIESSSYCIRDLIVRIINGKTYWILDVNMRPYKGQTFPTFEEDLAFYKEYARKSVCNKQGLKKKSAYDTLTDSNNKNRRRPSIRVNYETYVRMKVNNNNVWHIYELKEEHTHILTFSQKKIIYDMSNVNMGTSAAYKYMKESMGGFKNTGATGTDTKNFKRDWIEFIEERDANFVINKLTKKKDYLHDFSFDYSVGSNGELTGLFWSDEEAKRNYSVFGDVLDKFVISLFTRYKMIFVPFTAINNHKRCITFGAGLLSSESIESYSWLLHAFKKAFLKEPNVIVTDQDVVILQAVSTVFKNARHRLCM
uniref:Protein FAR1-RELATED SEQUENCE n=1 Tax=Lactuca sativa TaxID=4236 RepID=A0A9R1VKZ5_LACSA|nr:hypothetical protein LSAT_V11C400166570 [Lactuca sativa]